MEIVIWILVIIWIIIVITLFYSDNEWIKTMLLMFVSLAFASMYRTQIELKSQINTYNDQIVLLSKAVGVLASEQWLTSTDVKRLLESLKNIND